MKVKIIADTFIRGEALRAGKTLDVDDAVGRVLIENYKAERVVEKPAKPKAESTEKPTTEKTEE